MAKSMKSDAAAESTASQPDTGQSESADDFLGRRTRRRVSILFAIAAVYLTWLGWLAYVAWVNVQAGNQ